MDYVKRMYKLSEGIGKIASVLFILAILGGPMFSASVWGCDITDADIWAGHSTDDASEKNHSPSSKLYIKGNMTVYFYAECVAESGSSDDDSEDIRWRFYFGDGSSETEYTLDSESADTKTKTTLHDDYDDVGNYTIQVIVDRGHRTGTFPSYTWTSARPGASYSNTCKVAVFDVDITTPSSFPEYVCLNNNLSMVSTVYPSGASSAGTFSWTNPSGPGTVTWTTSDLEDPEFKADTVGTKSLSE